MKNGCFFFPPVLVPVRASPMFYFFFVGQACSLDVGERMAHALDGGEAKNTGSGRPLA